jgi:hypothetical protein
VQSDEIPQAANRVVGGVGFVGHGGLITVSRFRKFSLRGLMIVVTCAAVALGILGYRINSAKRQVAALLQIEALGGKPLRVRVDGNSNQVISGQSGTNKRPAWQNKLLGDEYFVYVPLISLRTATADDIKSMVPYINQIRLREGLNEVGKSNIALDVGGNPNVDRDLIRYLQQQLPQCVVVSADPAAKNPYQ